MTRRFRSALVGITLAAVAAVTPAAIAHADTEQQGPASIVQPIDTGSVVPSAGPSPTPSITTDDLGWG